MLQPIPIRIPKDLLEPTEMRSFEGALPPFKLASGADDYDFSGPGHWRADITNTGGALLVTGTVDAHAACACARCLEPAEYDLSGQIEGYFLIPGKDVVFEDIEEDEFEMLPSDETIDMAPLIQSALVLELPRIPLCKDDCAGLCSVCGHDLNAGPCGCELPDASPANPFAVLKDLKLD